MPDFATLFRDQAQASAHVQFVYDTAARRIVYVNPAYETVLDGTQAHVNEEVPGLLARLHPDDRRYFTYYWTLWKRGQMPDEVEVRLTNASQPDQWFLLTPFHQATGPETALLSGTLRDISTDKRYQQNADAFNTRKNASLEILSHDLSGSFAMVQQIGTLLQQELQSPAGSGIFELLRVLETTSRSSRKMIRDLMSVEFLASANTDLKRERVEISTTLRPPLEELQRNQGLLGHRFTFSLPPEPLYVYLDVNKMTQVLTNLLSNALKFTPDQGEITVVVEPCLGGVRLQVRDTGVGIPTALQPYLFERFTKARRPGLRGEETVGLGLVLCKTIVEWHKGTLSFTSTEGQGSTFTVELPLAEAALLA
jgi:two-component system sensor histidine kinase VicK